MNNETEFVVVEFLGKLTEPDLLGKMAAVTQGRSNPPVLVIDARQMTGYEASAREAFVQWNRENSERFEAVAVVVERPMWRMVIRTIALLSGQRMEPFDELPSALKWAKKLGACSLKEREAHVAS